MALVAGDRQSDGIFPQWSIAQNIGVRSLARLRNGLLISPQREAELAAFWQKKIGIRTPDMNNNIFSLSGGNQQKALFARALGSDAGIVLMDDPMRGVDIGTKLEVYDLVQEEARRGRTFLWYTTETEELDNCDTSMSPRTAASSPIVATGWPKEDHQSSFGGEAQDDGRQPRHHRQDFRRAWALARAPAARAACAVAGAGAAAIAWLNPRAISYFGFSLMLNLAIPIALATIAQMFVIAGNELDLSIGTFVGFVGCVTATWLKDAPLVGVVILLGSIGVYALLGALIHLRNLPSIVVTLGMSFVWQGLAILVLPKPGGKAPDWLLAFMAFKPPFVPFPIIAALLIGLIVHFGLMRTSYGVICAGPAAIRQRSRARRLVAAQDQDRAVSLAGLFAFVGHGADRHHHFGRCQYRQWLHAAGDRASSSAAANSSAAGCADRRGDGARRWHSPPAAAHLRTFRPTGRWPPMAPS